MDWGIGSLSRDVLYYDGQCALCRAEIAQLHRFKDRHLELVDIHSLSEVSDLPPRDQLLQTLHLRRGDAGFELGLYASVVAWQHTRIGPLWRVLLWPGVRPLAECLYRHWARWRFRRLYHVNDKS